MTFTSRWDIWTWLIVAITAALCLWPIILDFELVPAIICTVSFLFILVTLMSVYYRIDGDKLKVYALFRHQDYPIEQIAEIKPTKSALAAPASSLTHRIAITFTDRSVLKSSDPLIISPKKLSEFIAQLKAVNSDINVSSELQ